MSCVPRIPGDDLRTEPKRNGKKKKRRPGRGKKKVVERVSCAKERVSCAKERVSLAKLEAFRG